MKKALTTSQAAAFRERIAPTLRFLYRCRKRLDSGGFDPPSYLGASRIICGDSSLRRSISRLNERETQRCGWTSKQLGRR
jgi:hypothetical protein